MTVFVLRNPTGPAWSVSPARTNTAMAG